MPYKKTKEGRRRHAAYMRGWYQNHKVQHLKAVRRSKVARKARLAAIVRALKERPCLDCQQTYPVPVMEFDHRSEKWKPVPALIAGSYSLVKIMREIERCDVVCANCHRLRTWRRNQQNG